uniref:Uncharacterized protein n=1 Tax=Rousettus aegyptiacus TaxID=9407 RepID=A0A7J8E7S8_ROUAE|nr:hypothetical protein HJG63_008074 [Rousettus aegyptiacus]
MSFRIFHLPFCMNIENNAGLHFMKNYSLLPYRGHFENNTLAYVIRKIYFLPPSGWNFRNNIGVSGIMKIHFRPPCSEHLGNNVRVQLRKRHFLLLSGGHSGYSIQACIFRKSYSVLSSWASLK